MDIERKPTKMLTVDAVDALSKLTGTPIDEILGRVDSRDRTIELKQAQTVADEPAKGSISILDGDSAKQLEKIAQSVKGKISVDEAKTHNQAPLGANNKNKGISR